MKPLAHFEGKYAVTENGDIINLATNQPLKPTKNPNGYLKVGLGTGDGRHEQLLVHRIIAKHFIPNPYDHEQVNHKDGNKENNAANNLEWVSCQENIEHAFRTKLRSGYMSATEKEYYLSRILNGEQVADIANEIGRHPNVLHKMLRTTADRLGVEVRAKWDTVMKENRKRVAIRQLAQINN